MAVVNLERKSGGQLRAESGGQYRRKIQTPAYPLKDYLEGRNQGSCDHTILGTDAAKEIQKYIDRLYHEDPPLYARFWWPNPVTVTHCPDFTNISDYRNENDPGGDPLDNELDYLIFYMDQIIEDNYENPHCMLQTFEIPFYREQYIIFLENTLQSGDNYKYKECTITGSLAGYWIGQNHYDYMVHSLEYIVGKRFTCYPVNIYPISIIDL
jgi:hypothetical protein